MLKEEEQQALDQLKEMVDEWRNNKKHVSEKIPEPVWSAIFGFLKTTTMAEIEVLKTIGVKSEQINSKRKLLGLISSAPAVSRENESKKILSSLSETEMTQVEITRPDGCIIRFQAPFSELQRIIS
jgi:hypothetical protein